MSELQHEPLSLNEKLAEFKVKHYEDVADLPQEWDMPIKTSEISEDDLMPMVGLDQELQKIQSEHGNDWGVVKQAIHDEEASGGTYDVYINNPSLRLVRGEKDDA